MIELACPESCQYLIDARKHAGSRESGLIVPELAQNRRLLRQNDERFVTALYAIDSGVIRAHRGESGEALRDLLDEEVLAALENVVKNIETEESGLIYEHRAASPRVQFVSRQIQAALDEATEKASPFARPHRSDLLDALNLTLDRVRAHIKRGGEDAGRSRTYLRHIALYYPWPAEATHPLIISSP